MRPDWCPPDVWEAAAQTASILPIGGHDERESAETVARAILAERERLEALLKDPVAVRVNYLRGDIACQPLIDEAVAAERERCAAVANERVAQLMAAYNLPGGDDAKAGYAGQMIEALLIEQRLSSGHVAKQSINVEGLHKLAEGKGF